MLYELVPDILANQNVAIDGELEIKRRAVQHDTQWLRPKLALRMIRVEIT